MDTLKERDAATQPPTTQAATTKPKPTESAANQPVSTVSKPTAWRRFRMTTQRHPRLVKLGLFSAIATTTAFLLLYSLFKGAWSADRDNFAILQTIFKMELGRDSTLAINGNPQRVITRSFTSLEPHVAQEDWEWSNRFGSTITYQKQDRWLIASCTPYSPLYLICDLSEVP